MENKDLGCTSWHFIPFLPNVLSAINVGFAQCGLDWLLFLMWVFDVSVLCVVRFSIKTLLTLVWYIIASGLQEEPFDQQARNASLLYTFPQWSARPLKGLAVGVSHNAFSHRETSSQHEQGRNVARVWERLSGLREGVMDQRAWSRDRRKEGVCTEGSRVSLKQMEFLFGFTF